MSLACAAIILIAFLNALNIWLWLCWRSEHKLRLKAERNVDSLIKDWSEDHTHLEVACEKLHITTTGEESIQDFTDLLVKRIPKPAAYEPKHPIPNTDGRCSVFDPDSIALGRFGPGPDRFRGLADKIEQTNLTPPASGS